MTLDETKIFQPKEGVKDETLLRQVLSEVNAFS